MISNYPELRTMSQLKECNMSMYKDAIVSINGFDEDFFRPAIGEDIDLVWRFYGEKTCTIDLDTAKPSPNTLD